MKDCRINAQNDIIKNILFALDTCSQGLGMKEKYEIKKEPGNYGSTLVFTPMLGFEMNPADFFWLGYYFGRDYDGKD